MVSVVAKRKHTVNGRFYGWWMDMSDGTLVYAAYRKGCGTRGFHRNSNSWCLDVATLNDAMFKGVKLVMVIHDESKGKRRYYATPIEDLFGPFSEPHTVATTRQRRLPRQCWRVNPLVSEAYVARTMTLRR